MRSKGTILITGAAKRVGSALALALAKAGYDIALHYHRSEREALALAASIKRLNRGAELFKCDLNDEPAVLKLIPEVKKQNPSLTALINNASVFKPSRISGSSMEAFRLNINVNLRAPYILTKQYARHCANGSIINILDTHILSSNSKHADYLLSKKALAALSELSAAELAPAIRVNAIAPGLILPPEGKSQSYLDQRAKGVPLKKKGSPANIAHAALFLLENDYVTGQTIFVDGGEHLS